MATPDDQEARGERPTPIVRVGNYVIACHRCGWKVVSPDPDRDMAGHQRTLHRDGGRKVAASFHLEPHVAGHPTMPLEKAIEFGHIAADDVEVARYKLEARHGEIKRHAEALEQKIQATIAEIDVANAAAEKADG